MASDEINYRRFFDINELAALRVEEPRVFEAVQGLALDLAAQGWVDGLRIDHPDGLLDPAAYFERLQAGYARRRRGDCAATGAPALYVVPGPYKARRLHDTWLRLCGISNFAPRKLIMKFISTKISTSIAALSAALLASTGASAADSQATRSGAMAPQSSMQNGADYSDRARMKGWSNEKDQLERELRLGQNKAFYVKTLADRGFQITSVNSSEANSAEYEVVKGNQRYEVQIDFDNAGKATEIDVTTNMWRTDATKAAMRGEKVPMATGFVKGNEAYSDRARMKTWSNEKDRLEKTLALGHEKGYYGDQLKAMGYQVTSTNDNDRDYVEYEIVKGADSYEVQIDFTNGKAREVDVTTNVWQSEATERALSGNRR